MRKSHVCLVLTVCTQLGSAPCQKIQRRLETEKGEARDALVEHPLAWWTKDPLRLDSSGDLMLGFKAPDGLLLGPADYRVAQTITKVGVLAGQTILQVQTTIQPGKRVVAAGYASNDGNVGEWKDLLVSSRNPGQYFEIYALHYDGGGLIHETPAHIFGSGSDAVLGSYDPDTGNGGGCLDGYWWFDQKGPHEVDFAPLLEAIQRKVPANATFTPNCWALHPVTSELRSWVQRQDAECHGCGGLGKVHAIYKIVRGVALPVTIDFESSKQ